ncbi:phage scaffolding protein [Salibacterium aidingense]|uniref:phage scaffolding protein n=1 Tax=Salibacterium aidingense TaxID=384933 RepID=UPI003BD06579
MTKYKLNLQYFAEGDGEPNEPAEPTEPTGGQDDPAAEPKTPDSETKEPPKGESDKAIPYERFKQVNDEAKTYKETFKELGIDSVDSLKELVSDYQAKKEAEEARKREEMSEIEQLQADLDAKKEAEQTYQQQLADYQAKVREQQIRNAFITEAQAANVAYVEDAYQLAQSDLSAVEVDEDSGEVSGVSDVVMSLIENKPFLLAQESKQPKKVGDSANHDTSNEVKSLETKLEEAKEKKDFGKVLEISNQIKSKMAGK